MLVWALEVCTCRLLLGLSKPAVESVLWQEEVPLSKLTASALITEAKPWHKAARCQGCPTCVLPTVTCLGFYVIKNLFGVCNLVTRVVLFDFKGLLNFKAPCYYSKIFTTWLIWFFSYFLVHSSVELGRSCLTLSLLVELTCG